AINAITMTPARAVVIFKTEEREGGHHFKKEAVPWWLFGILGGCLTIWLGHKYLDGRIPALAVPAEEQPAWSLWAIGAVYFTHGAVLGGLIGWFIANPINAVLRQFFKLFNAGFDWLVRGYGTVVGGLLRISVIVLVAYGGLLFLTYWQFNRTPTGFVP